LGYSPLGSDATGTARSMSYLVGRGTGGDAHITVKALNEAQPYAVVMRLPGPLPYVSRFISGTVSAPEGASLRGTVLVACHIIGGKCIESSLKTRSFRFDTPSQSSGYSLAVEPVDYGVFAFKDANGDGSLGAGDYFGCYGTATGCIVLKGSSSITAVNVRMQVMTGLTGQGTDVLPQGVIQPRLTVDTQALFHAFPSRTH
jgi:hypothetical protein